METARFRNHLPHHAPPTGAATLHVPGRETSYALTLALVVLAGPAAWAAEPPSGGGDPAQRIVAAAMRGGRAYERLAWLTDRIGPRLSGSARLEEAIRWSAATLEADGLDRVWTEKVMVPHWVRGEERARVVGPVDQPLAVSALGGSIGTPAEGIEAEVVEVRNFDDLRALGDGARGKIVLFNQPIVRNGEGEEGYGSASRLRWSGAVEAARVGAVGMLIRSLGTASYRLPHTGSMGYEDDTTRIPAAAVAAEDAGLLHRLLASGDPVRVRLTLGCRMLPDAESANVLAEIRGGEKPEEVVLIGAHLDSWDVGTGAIDDGAGVAIVMETMRLLRTLDLRPGRTIRAVLFTNEENGLRGGQGYAAAHREEIPLHVAAMESDSGAGRPLGFGVTAGPAGVEVVRRIASSLADIGADEVRDRGGGADISPLRRAGVPVLGLRQDATYYFDYHHTEADTLDKVDPDDLARNVAAMAVMAHGLANAPEPLPRLEPEPAAEE